MIQKYLIFHNKPFLVILDCQNKIGSCCLAGHVKILMLCTNYFINMSNIQLLTLFSYGTKALFNH